METINSQQNSIIDGVDTANEESKKKAAYALNLCTVSISQIVDYDDINILEQEYEGILNNLNLYNMPKDEALLRILKQILDTVTFFRIQEGDKALIEESYQQQLNDVIWSAVPNLGMLVAGGSLVTMAISLVTQVGLGYMNYRREKAKAKAEHKKQMWQLQRTAIEQFDGLRRELFDTAWRLADRYGFKDCYRLTERQISQYNDILMDDNTLRKFERLDNIKENFEAYPPFWYYIGSAANAIVAENPDDLAIRAKYGSLAIEYFNKFREIKNLDLLREDKVRSSCCLEYVSLLLPHNNDTNRKIILELLDDALAHSGHAKDVMQTCATYYLSIGETSKAMKLLRELVVEKYNSKTNAILLSRLYYAEALKSEKEYSKYYALYRTLSHFEQEQNLIKLPDTFTELISNRDNSELMFLANQRRLLLQHFKETLDKLICKNSINLNRELFCPDETAEQFPDTFYIATEKAKGKRNYYLKGVSYSSKEWNNYTQALNNKCIESVFHVIINDYLRSIDKLFSTVLGIKKPFLPTSSIKEYIERKKDTIKSLHEKLANRTFKYEDFEKLHNITLSSILNQFSNELYNKTLPEKIKDIKEYKEIIDKDLELACYTAEEGLDDIICDDASSLDQTVVFDKPDLLDIAKILGAEDEMKFKKGLKDIFNKYAEEGTLFMPSAGKDFNLHAEGTKQYSSYLSTMEDSERKELETHGDILAVLGDYPKNMKKHIFFLQEGICIYSWHLTSSNWRFQNYEKCHLSPNNSRILKVDDSEFENDQICMDKVLECIEECAFVSTKNESLKSACFATSIRLGSTLFFH